MKTRREHLSVLPAEILEEIHEEIKTNLCYHLGKQIDLAKELEESLERKAETFNDAILGAFILTKSEKGAVHWMNIIAKYSN